MGKTSIFKNGRKPWIFMNISSISQVHAFIVWYAFFGWYHIGFAPMDTKMAQGPEWRKLRAPLLFVAVRTIVKNVWIHTTHDSPHPNQEPHCRDSLP